MLGRTLMLTPGYDMSVDDSPTDGDPWTNHTKSIFAKASVFGSIHSAGQYKWEGIETANNGYNSGVTFVSNERSISLCKTAISMLFSFMLLR